MIIKNKKRIIFLFLAGLVLGAQAQQSFLFGDKMAVFYPADFDSVQTLPSFAVQKDLVFQNDLPADWKIKPVYGTNSEGKITVKISFDAAADLYGTGLVTGTLRRNGTDIKLWNHDNWGYYSEDGKCLYQTHPWIMGVRVDGSSFGIIADNTWRQHFELSNPIKITTEGPSFRVIVIERKNPVEMIKALGELTGKIELPPLWAIGYQQSRFSPSYTSKKAKEIAGEFRKRNIPCDVIWMDIDYMNGKRIFTFDPANFSDPVGLNNYLQEKKIKAGYIIDPGVKIDNNYFVYKEGSAGNHWVKNKNGGDYVGEVWPGNCHFPDFSRPETRSWWASLYGDFVKTNQIDGVWNDMNEPGVFNTEGWTMPVDNIHRGGSGFPEGTHLRYHNLYGSWMSQATYEGILAATPNKRPFVLSRGNHLGAQRYCATWTGDNRGTWEHMKMSVPMSITLGLSGQPFSGPDVGGYSQKISSELFGHWMALSAYYPYSRNHTGEEGFYQEPWAFGEDIENISRTALNRRYRLLPYFYTLFREAAQTGVPLMRPVFFADFTDKNLRKEEQAFLLGKDLLIIPIWAIDPKLPSGDWDVLKLEDEEDAYQPLVALRAGAIVPLAQLVQATADYVADSLTLLVNPLADGSAEGILYNDAGNGFAYKTGGYEVLKFNASKHDDTQLKIEIAKTEGTVSVDNRHYRIGYVTDNRIVYSDWTTDQTIYVPIIEDTTAKIDLSKLGVMFVGGTFNNWKLEDMPMKRMADGSFESDAVKLKAGSFEFKFANTVDWSSIDWGNSEGLSGTIEKGPYKPNAKFTIDKGGMYVFSFNPNTLKYTIQRTRDYSNQDEMYVAGTFSNWSLLKMELIGNSLWHLADINMGQGAYELKFANTNNFSGDDWGNAVGLSGKSELTTGGKPNIKFTIPANEKYSFTFNDETLEYSIRKTNASNVENIKANAVYIYPNPASDVLNIHTGQELGTAEIVTLSGQNMMKLRFDRPFLQLDISSLEKGAYLVKIVGNNDAQTTKLLKK